MRKDVNMVFHFRYALEVVVSYAILLTSYSFIYKVVVLYMDLVLFLHIEFCTVDLKMHYCGRAEGIYSFRYLSTKGVFLNQNINWCKCYSAITIC